MHYGVLNGRQIVSHGRRATRFIRLFPPKFAVNHMVRPLLLRRAASASGGPYPCVTNFLSSSAARHSCSRFLPFLQKPSGIITAAAGTSRSSGIHRCSGAADSLPAFILIILDTGSG